MGEDWVNNGGFMPKRLGISNVKAQKLDISPRTSFEGGSTHNFQHFSRAKLPLISSSLSPA
jgi:hypothetical protein